MIALWMAWATSASAETLPGLPLRFEVSDSGVWTAAETWSSGGETVQAGWRLTEVAGRTFEAGPARREVADGPARDIRLRFDLPVKGPEAPVSVVVTVHREPLVRVVRLPDERWPEGFTAPVGQWLRQETAPALVVDASGATWTVDDGGITRVAPPETLPADLAIPAPYWAASPAPWAVDAEGGGLEVGDAAWASKRFAQATHLGRLGGRSSEHLVIAAEQGLQVYEVTFPKGTATLPRCDSAVPETCLASGADIRTELAHVPGSADVAAAHFEVACTQGVRRGCFEELAVLDQAQRDAAEQCLDGQLASCVQAATAYHGQAGAKPELALGLYQYTCEQESSKSLGTRLRSLEDIGAGCMGLVGVYDERVMPDQALLTLDTACVLGRAEACTTAEARRHQAFAARVVRECEDVQNPVADSCVQLGDLLQGEAVPATTLDAFGAYLRGCNYGSDQSCRSLGDYVNRWGIDHPRVAEATTKLQAACNDGELRACYGAGQLLVRHEPNTEAYADALLLFDRACEGKHAPACVAGAEQRRIGKARGADAPPQSAMWTMACELQDAKGCAGLGASFARKKRTWPEAFSAWSVACDIGSAASCTDLGQLVVERHGDPWPNEQASETYLERGCSGGDAEGCYDLTVDAELKAIVDADYLLLEKSCSGDFGAACADLAVVHLNRRTNFDDEIAAGHLQSACDNGHYASCQTLGNMYLKGKGVERDRKKARELLDQFQHGAPPRYVKLGVKAGMVNLVGGEAEFVAPIPWGPALSLGVEFSQLPGAGSLLPSLENDDIVDAPALRYLALSARLYPNHQARGAYGALGFQTMSTVGGNPSGYERSGWSGRIGMRSDKKWMYSGLEFGVGYLGLVDTQNFDEDSDAGKIPLIVPMLAFSVGVAPI